MDDSSYKKAADILKLFGNLFSSEKLEQGGEYLGLTKSWSSFVGEQIAAHSKINDIVDNILFISVDHPGWIQTLQFKQTAVLQSINNKYPSLKLRGIVFQLAK